MTKLIGCAQPWPECLTFTCDLPRLNKGGVDAVRQWIEQANQPRLIIIDTLAKVRDVKGSQESTYEADYQSVSNLTALANEHRVSIILVHHQRKMEAEDPLDSVSGTTGLTGAVDTVAVLLHDSQGTRLHARGRDIEEIDVVIQFNRIAAAGRCWARQL